MNCEQIKLNVGNAVLDSYRPDLLGAWRGAVLVIPGGGYHQVCADREGEPIALAYASRGFAAFVLHYSVDGDLPQNKPLAEASAALAYIRRNSGQYGIDPNHIYAVGFSAGGHLCGTLATLWHNEEICRLADITPGENRPDAVVLCYPVVTGGEYAHRSSFVRLLGTEAPDTEALAFYSVEKQVDGRSAPAFLIHTAEDELVPVQNSLLLAKAYADASVPFELHVYPHGSHGFALGTEVTDIWARHTDSQYARWVDDSIYFFQHL